MRIGFLAHLVHGAYPSPMTQESTPDLANSPLPCMGTLIAIAVGNTRTRVGSFADQECLNPHSFDSADADAIAGRVQEIVDSAKEGSGVDPTIVIAGVRPTSSDEIERAIRKATGQTIYRFGRDFQIPIQHTLTDAGEMTVGQDRLLCAIGAFEILKQACVVIDVGTAVTVDFVDGTGVYHGGAILPGIRAMLGSLHDSTANLPKLVYHRPDERSKEPAKQTDEAMMLGVTYAVKGAVRSLTERYAEHYQGYPQTIVTGGDLGVLEDDELIDSFVPDLQLQGIRVAFANVLADDES